MEAETESGAPIESDEDPTIVDVGAAVEPGAATELRCAFDNRGCPVAALPMMLDPVASAAVTEEVPPNVGIFPAAAECGTAG